MNKILLTVILTIAIVIESGTSVFPSPANGPGDGDDILKYEKALFDKKKDPIFSGMMSWYMPGLGQYYCGRVVKGTAFLVTEYALFLGAIFYFLDFDFAAGGSSGFNVGIDAKRTDIGVVETSRKNVFIALMSLVAVIHVVNVSDAYYSAKDFNRQLEEERNRLRSKYPNIRIGFENKRGVYIAAEKRL
jgi:hypothetical protein